MEIIVKIRRAYGNDLIDPVCATAHAFLRLTGRKTFTRADIAAIRALGYDVSVQPAEQIAI